MTKEKFHVDLGCGIFPWWVLLSVGESTASVVKLVQSRLPNNTKEDLVEDTELYHEAGCYHFEPQGNILIRLRRLDLALLTHELYHAAMFIMKNIRETPTDDHCETVAYLLQYWVDKVITFSDKLKTNDM